MPKPKHNTKSQREVRLNAAPQKFEIRSNEDGTRSVSGYAIVWNSLSQDLGNFKELVTPGAVTQSLKDNPDIFIYFSHDSSRILGRVSSGTLTIAEDNIGLRFTCQLPDTTFARDLIVSMERSDIHDMSFGFGVPQGGDEWAEVNGQVIRTLTRILLYEISVVGEGAYQAPQANLRSCPAQIRSLLTRSEGDEDDNDDDLDCDGVDADDPRCNDDEDDEDEGDDDDFDERSEDYRCQYRCLACRSADFAHQSNLTVDSAAERSKRSAAVKTSLSEDDLAQEAARCAYRCAACRSLLSGHFPVPHGVSEDGPTRAAHLKLLLARL